MIKSKKQMILVIISFILVLVLGTVSYAFYNYTRTGSANTVSVGRLNFTSTENNTINLSNVFPTDSTHLNSSNSSTVTINITGDTNYDRGIEYKVSLVDVNNVVNNKEVAMGFTTTATNLGTKSSDYYNDRGSTTNVYNLVESGRVNDDELILIGYIKPDENGVNGSINVTAYIDKDKVAISDTVSTISNGNLIYEETPGEWIAGREVFTTTEWNSLSTNGVSFKIKVEANEGIWVEEPEIYVLKNLNDVDEWKDYRENVTRIEFDISGEVPNISITSFDATDLTSFGPVTIYILDDGSGNNTYKAIASADNIIYSPEDSVALFAVMPLLSSFDSTNFRVDNAVNMQAMYNRDASLTSADFTSNWNVSKVQNMVGMFFNCTRLQNINALVNWNTENLTDMNRMFYNCESLNSVSSLYKWKTSTVTNMYGLFYNCSSLDNIDSLVNWDISNVINISGLLWGTSVYNANGLSNWNTSKVEYLNGLFYECNNLQNIDGLANWDTSSVKEMIGMFYTSNALYNQILDVTPLTNWNTGSLVSSASLFLNRSINSYYPLRNWNVSKVEDFSNMFNATPVTTITSLSGLENWNVSSAANMTAMFKDNFSLTDASAINNWNINPNSNFTQMFGNTPVHPEFTRVQGTWDENGTFTPA